ncbi:fibronectin type III domain-containing protein, partial [Candidatus Woesebacteria bacterium]|nr:fibronectin type III domain-containing protein [Candidatus Woesebacteria bacterium]
MKIILKIVLVSACFVGLFNSVTSQTFANAYQFNTSNQSGEITCLASDLGCEWAGYANFTNVSGSNLWNTTAWIWSSRPGLLRYSSWTKGWTSEQDSNPASYPVEPNNAVSLALIMENPGLPGVYQASINLDGKTCNLNTTPWDCYFRGSDSFTITMTVVGNPTATPTTIPPTATPTTRPPSATATPTGSQPTLTPTPTTPSGQATPTPTSGVTSPTPTSSTSQTTANNTTNSGTADSAGTQAKPKTCSATVPNAPKLLLIKPVSQTSVTLEWSEVANASHYAVSYGTKSGSYLYGISNTGKTTSFTVKSLGKNSVYYFVVQAISDCAPSKISNELSTEVNQALPEKSVEEIIADVESSKSA